MTSFLEDDLSTSIKEGNFYEAHQLYLSISQRLLKQKKWTESLEKLIEGIRVLTEAGQMKSAADLSNKFIQYLAPTESNVPLTHDFIQHEWNGTLRNYCVQVVKYLQLPQLSAKDIVVKSLNISKKLNKTDAIPMEDNLLHYEYGLLFAQIHDYYTAIHHLVLGASVDSFLKIQDIFNSLFGMTFSESNFTNQDNVQLLSFAILNYLKIKKHQDAYNLLTCLICRLKELRPDLVQSSILIKSKYQTQNTDVPIFLLSSSYSLYNFLQLIIITLAKSCKSHLNKLATQYRIALSSTNQTLLDDLESVYFSSTSSRSTLNNTGQSSTAQQVAGMINNVFRGLFSNFNPMARTSSNSSSIPTSSSAALPSSSQSAIADIAEEDHDVLSGTPVSSEFPLTFEASHTPDLD